MANCVSNAADRVYVALRKAAERIGMRNYRAGLYKVERRRGKVVRGYSITEAHKAVIDAMPKVCGGKITPEEAMSILREHDVMRERFNGYKRSNRRRNRRRY